MVAGLEGWGPVPQMVDNHPMFLELSTPHIQQRTSSYPKACDKFQDGVGNLLRSGVVSDPLLVLHIWLNSLSMSLYMLGFYVHIIIS